VTNSREGTKKGDRGIKTLENDAVPKKSKNQKKLPFDFPEFTGDIDQRKQTEVFREKNHRLNQAQ